jgi:hypothetical protein
MTYVQRVPERQLFCRTVIFIGHIDWIEFLLPRKCALLQLQGPAQAYRLPS